MDKLKPFQREKHNFILASDKHDIVEPRLMQKNYKKYLEEAEIDETTFHTLRHAFATRCIEAGFDINTLSEILGHSSVKITLDTYVHSSMQLKRDSMDKLEVFND